MPPRRHRICFKPKVAMKNMLNDHRRYMRLLFGRFDVPYYDSPAFEPPQLGLVVNARRPGKRGNDHVECQ